jgi:hypothetical protein
MEREMSKLKECALCRLSYQVPHIVPVFANTLYVDEARSIKVNLCYIHDIELFKIGQYRFAEKYSHLANNVVASDDSNFLKRTLWQTKR